MNDFTGFFNCSSAVGSNLAHDSSAHGLDYGAKGRMHVAGLVQLVIRPAPVEFQSGDAPFVFLLGINRTVAIFIGNHLAATAKADE